MSTLRFLSPLRSALTAAVSTLLLVTGCTGAPKGTQPIPALDIERYLGKWYEIARFDHRFERDLECVTAQYSMRDDGLIKVINRGRNRITQQWKEAEGKAAPLSNPADGRLKVSFFGPFYSGYNVLVLDEAYRYALVVGPNRHYLWILSRTPTLDDDTYNALVATAKSQGFDTAALQRVPQDAENCATL